MEFVPAKQNMILKMILDQSIKKVLWEDGSILSSDLLVRRLKRDALEISDSYWLTWDSWIV